MKVIVSYFQQPLSNFTLVLLSIELNVGARLLSYLAGGLIISSVNPLDFQDEIRSVLPIFYNYLYIG